MPEEYNWIAMLNRLSNDDITKHKEIYEINYIECLTQMMYWHQRDKYIDKINKEYERKNRR